MKQDDPHDDMYKHWNQKEENNEVDRELRAIIILMVAIVIVITIGSIGFIKLLQHL